MKNVLYISYDGMTDPLGQSQVLPYLAELSKEGYRFTILSFEKRDRYTKEGPVVRSLMEAAGVHWVPLFFTSRPPILSKIYDRYRMWQAALALHKKVNFQLVHCRSYIAAEMGLRLKQKFGVKMLFDMRGFWADEKVDNGQWHLEKVLYRRIYRHYKQKEKEFLLQADGIVSLTEAAKEYLLGEEPYKNLSIEVIPCCADLQHFNYEKVSAEESARYKRVLGIPPSAKVLTYLGSVGGWYMTQEMFRFFARLQQKDPLYVMLVLTKDAAGRVRTEAAEYGIPPEKVFVTYSTRADLPAYLSLCTASIFFIRDTFSKKASSPTKHAELMGMGIPIICNDIGDTGHIINTTKTGIVVNHFDETSLEKAVDGLYSLETIDPSYIRQCAFNLFDLQTGVQRYSDLYHRILQDNGSSLSHKTITTSMTS